MIVILPTGERDKAHLYALLNCPEVLPFLEEHDQMLESCSKEMTEDEKNNNFVEWFREKVEELYKNGNCPYGDELLSLARKPTPYVKSYNGYVTNGFMFHTVDRELGLKTPNSGVLMVSNAGDEDVDIDYYGVLTEVFGLEYTGGNEVLFFRCKWWDIDQRRGIKVDKFGYVSVNCQRLLKANDPFVLAAQASQVFYVNDIIQKGWRIVVKVQPRDSYEVLLEEDERQASAEDSTEAYQQNFSSTAQLATPIPTKDFEFSDVDYRNDVQADIVDISSLARKKKKII